MKRPGGRESFKADTGVGNPKNATSGKGEHLFDAVTNKIAGFITELAQTDIDEMYED